MLLVLSSCKKNYKCSCRTVVNYWGGSETFTSEAKPMEKRLTKDQAEAVCDREATALDEVYKNFLSNNGAWSTNGAYARSTCTSNPEF
jgi:hypothetical protein